MSAEGLTLAKSLGLMSARWTKVDINGSINGEIWPGGTNVANIAVIEED